MDNITRTALLESIEKWKRNAVALTPQNATLGSRECPLCVLFSESSPTPCIGCPVSQKTGKTSCWDTPYPDVVDEHNWWEEHPGNETFRRRFLLRAADELHFLETLLKDDENERTRRTREDDESGGDGYGADQASC